MSGKRYALLAAIAFLASYISGAAQEKFSPREITAQSFVLVDKSRNGKKRAELSLTPEGKPILRFYDENGKVIWAANEIRAYPVKR